MYIRSQLSYSACAHFETWLIYIIYRVEANLDGLVKWLSSILVPNSQSSNNINLIVSDARVSLQRSILRKKILYVFSVGNFITFKFVTDHFLRGSNRKLDTSEKVKTYWIRTLYQMFPFSNISFPVPPT